MNMKNYVATYKDKRGTEEIVIKSNGSEMFTTIRDIDFDGGDFDQLTANKIDNAKFDYELFADGSGDITNFLLTITFPIQFYNSLSNQTFSENLVTNIVVGEGTTIKGLDHELNGLTLNTSFGRFKVEKRLEWMEDALIALQKLLPENIYLKTCLSCKYSNYSPFGNGMFGSIYCFKKFKPELKLLNDKTDLFEIWSKEAMDNGDILSVQETFDCSEHQLLTDEDWVYKSWTKTIKINEEIATVENTLFYKEVNMLLRNRFSVIKQSITPQYKQLLKERQFKHPLPIITKFEYAIWEGNRQWRLELDFDDYQWSIKTSRPHFLNAFVSIETTKEAIHFKYQLCSSFNEELQPMETEKIVLKKLNDTDFVANKIEEVQVFLKDLPKRFIVEIEKINFNDLEFLEDMEEVYEIINLHKVNDTKAFHMRTQLFFFDAIALMDIYINDYEKNIMEQARKMYTQEVPFCLETLKKHRISLAKKRYSEINISDERVNLFNAINGFLTPFEEYTDNDEIERPYELEYKLDFLFQVGLEYKQLISLMKKHFEEIKFNNLENEEA